MTKTLKKRNAFDQERDIRSFERITRIAERAERTRIFNYVEIYCFGKIHSDFHQIVSIYQFATFSLVDSIMLEFGYDRFNEISYKRVIQRGFVYFLSMRKRLTSTVVPREA